MFIDVDHEIEQFIELFKVKIAMKNHEAKLSSSFFMELKYMFFSTIRICFDNNGVIVIEQSHYQPLVHYYD